MQTTTHTPALEPGFADPGRHAGALFRALLNAMARPGTIHPLPVRPGGHGGLGPATAAVLLTLADFTTPLWLSPEADTPEARAFLRFHCNSRITGDPGEAAFAVLDGHAPLPDLDFFSLGDEAYPDRSTTLILRVAKLAEGPGGLRLSGPGIKGEKRLDVPGLSPAWAASHQANRALFPMGLDTVFAGPGSLCCVPRTTRILQTPREA
ncbi:phosphonate C-P lyase system protein PhnH [Desulfocurvus sp. DL9XJH121]